MNITLINGHFESRDTLDLITQLIHQKIIFHEAKISSAQDEEDMKMRERRIKELQKELFEVRQYVLHHKGALSVKCSIELL